MSVLIVVKGGVGEQLTSHDLRMASIERRSSSVGKAVVEESNQVVINEPSWLLMHTANLRKKI